VVVEGGAGGGAGGGAVVEVVVVVGGAVGVVVVDVAGARRAPRWNAAAADAASDDRWPTARPKLATSTAMTAQLATNRISTSPAARPRRAGGEGMGEGS
jgi:hypothetical protein